MALNKTIIKNFYGKEVSFEDAYHKITFLAGNKEKMNITLGIYNKEQNNLIEEKYYIFAPSVDDGSTDFIEQAYIYVKTLPEYADAVDC